MRWIKLLCESEEAEEGVLRLLPFTFFRSLWLARRPASAGAHRLLCERLRRRSCAVAPHRHRRHLGPAELHRYQAARQLHSVGQHRQPLRHFHLERRLRQWQVLSPGGGAMTARTRGGHLHARRVYWHRQHRRLAVHAQRTTNQAALRSEAVAAHSTNINVDCIVGTAPTRTESPNTTQITQPSVVMIEQGATDQSQHLNTAGCPQGQELRDRKAQHAFLPS